MERKFLVTGDGSVTIHLPEWNEQYHSKHGAVQEAEHVFLQAGLDFYLEQTNRKMPVHILEIGFGTGLNAFLSLVKAATEEIGIVYTGVEAYPVSLEEVTQLNYPKIAKAEAFSEAFEKMHGVAWEQLHEIRPGFTLKKQQKKFSSIKDEQAYDLIYFDAFGARVQPELWTEEIFQLMFQSLKEYGVLVTYAAKGSVRRAMLSAGFQVEKLPGPPGKREMLRAVKIPGKAS
ncbi:MAG: tRNA (5-methylaminomethyl-2-thiouridine)(34)-methyltransferase MnmD [Christiangramia sp.]|nr:SAM-dependent methyltransferase [Christiangramia sp.]